MTDLAPEQPDTVDSTAVPPNALTGWAALQHVHNQQVPADLNAADELLTEALQVLAP